MTGLQLHAKWSSGLIMLHHKKMLPAQVMNASAWRMRRCTVSWKQMSWPATFRPVDIIQIPAKALRHSHSLVHAFRSGQMPRDAKVRGSTIPQAMTCRLFGIT